MHIVNASTSWSSAYLQVYTRASSCAWTRQKFAPFEVRVINCSWTVAHDTFIVFACLVLIPVKFAPSQPSTGEHESATLTYWAVVFCGPLTTETIASFCPSLPLPSNGIDPLLNKLLFFSLMIRWLQLSVSKYTFEACFACSTQYFLGQLLRIFLRRFMAYLGQSCLSRPRLSVSHTPCTTSWCQPDRLLYGLRKDRLCLSPGLYGLWLEFMSHLQVIYVFGLTKHYL